MIIVWVPYSRRNSIDVELELDDVVFDPRIIVSYMAGGTHRGYKFRFSVKGRTLTITRTDDAHGREGWNDFWLRAYLPTEVIPDFTSTVYTYWGLDRERPPEDTTEVIIHPSVTRIKGFAFRGSRSLVRVTIPDTVTHIEGYAFQACNSLRFIRLSTNLVFIGRQAFYNCKLMEAVFLPPTVTQVDEQAFRTCTSLRFCILPDTIEHIGNGVFKRCDRLSTTVRNNLSKVCYSTSVTPQMIQECIDTHGIERATEVNDQQMTALHIICANPHVTSTCIRTYVQLAPEAANQEDSDGMTPFQRLCRNDITVLEDRSFASLMIWWYCCMP